MSVDNALTTDFASDNVLIIQNQEVVCFVIVDDDGKHAISIEPYFLTTSGIELYNIIQSTSDYSVNIDYSIICFRKLKNQYPNWIFSAH